MVGAPNQGEDQSVDPLLGEAIELEEVPLGKVSSSSQEDHNPWSLEEHSKSPEEGASLLSQVSFGWMTGLVKAGYKTPLMFENLPQLARSRDPEKHAEEFISRWEAERLRTEAPSAWAIIFRMYWLPLLITGGCAVFEDVAIVCNYILLQSIILWVQEGTGPVWEGLTYSVLIFLVSALKEAITRQHYVALNNICGMNTANAMATAVYRKTLRLPSAKTDKGEVVTLISVDSKEALKEFFEDIHVTWNGVVQVCVIFGLLSYSLGWAVLAAVAITAILVPLNLGLGVYWERLQKTVMEKQQKRVNAIAEALDGIDVIKYFHWESFVKGRIEAIRKLELVGIRGYALCIAFIMTIILANYTVTAMASFAVYYFLGNTLTAEIVFPRILPNMRSMYLFFISVWPLLHLSHQLAKMARARISMERIRQFLLLPELEQPEGPTVISDEWDAVSIDIQDSEGKASPSVGVSLRNCSFRHHGQGTTEDCLKDIEFRASAGELVAIVGEVGAGKSTLLRSILGETVATSESGEMIVNGDIAYCAQTPWIRNMTVRDNILAGKRYNELYYADTLTSCALLPDLAILPAGEHTEIGERGTNLSGGQKARVALARAVYSGRDVVLLDDPLSAVDAHVGNQLFHDCICGVLKHTTRILVTHQLQFLPFTDRIYIMKAGEIEHCGTYEELLQKGVTFATLAQDASINDSEQGDLRSSTERQQDAADILAEANTGDGKLIDEEEHQTGAVSFVTWGNYLLSMGGVPFLVVFAVMSIALITLEVSTSMVLAAWSTTDSDNLNTFFIIYVSLAMSYALLTGVRNLTWYLGAYQAAKKLHARMLSAILRAPIQFFSSTPKGRILNRFSKDQTVVDQYLPDTVSDVIICALDIAGKIVVLSIAAPVLLVVFIPIGVVYYLLQRVYRPTKRELARLDSINSSPIYEHCSESVDGVETIRAFKCYSAMISENMHRMRKSMMALYTLTIVERWMGARTSLTGSCISLAICCSSVAMVALGFRSPLTYLAISYSLDICGVLSWVVMTYAQGEAYMNHVERMLYYSATPSESEVVIKETEPPASWPEAGKISVQNLSVRYVADHDLVLKNLSFDVEAGHRVGIVGRTGAGKSTLLMSLFRLLEPCEGNIFIDGVDIHKLGLGALRSKISVIPQEPVLLSGSLRLNLDPTNTADDQALWRALEHAHVAEFVKTLPGGLDSEVDGAQSFSNGQKQLLCLARALLQETRILVMDEATASVDPDTDILIQETIRTEFAGRTILTIAHRLSTIIDYDRILVLDQGQLIEYGSPADLLEQKGAFFDLVEDTGASSSAHLGQLAAAQRG